METTSRFVDVPMVVAIPPTMVPRPMGIRMPEGGTRVRTATLISIGRSITTTGVLLTKALRAAASIRVARGASRGRFSQAWPRLVASGCRAPVLSRPLPSIIKAHTVISASLPKPVRNWAGANSSPPGRHGET